MTSRVPTVIDISGRATQHPASSLGGINPFSVTAAKPRPGSMNSPASRFRLKPHQKREAPGASKRTRVGIDARGTNRDQPTRRETPLRLDDPACRDSSGRGNVVQDRSKLDAVHQERNHIAETLLDSRRWVLRVATHRKAEATVLLRSGRARGLHFLLAGLSGSVDARTGSSRGLYDLAQHLTLSAWPEIHDRMPVIVPPEKYGLWLDPDVTNFEAIRDILKPYDASLMRRYPVTTKLNNSKNGSRSRSRLRWRRSTEPLFSRALC